MTVAPTTATTAPTATGRRESRRREAHSNAAMVSASHSANPLADTKRPRFERALSSGDSTSTSTTSSATANIIASRGRRHRSGIQFSRRVSAMRSARGGKTRGQPVAEVADFLGADLVRHRIRVPFDAHAVGL